MINLTKTNFTSEINSEGIVIVDFWAEWCKPCKKLSVILKKIDGNLPGEYKFCKFNIEDSMAIANTYGIMNLPTLIFFKNGEEYTRLIGLVGESKIIETIADGMLC